MIIKKFNLPNLIFNKKALIVALFTVFLCFLILILRPKVDFKPFLALGIIALYFALNLYLGLIFSLRIKKLKLKIISILSTIFVNIFTSFILMNFFIEIAVSEFYFPEKPKIINRLIFLFISLFLPIFWLLVNIIQKDY
jgi:hypothetical protein